MIRPTVLEESRTQVFHCCQSIMPATHHMIFGKYWTVCTEYTVLLLPVCCRKAKTTSIWWRVFMSPHCSGLHSNRHGQHFCIFYEMFIKENPLSGIFHINATKIAIACTIFRNEYRKKFQKCQNEVKKRKIPQCPRSEVATKMWS